MSAGDRRLDLFEYLVVEEIENSMIICFNRPEIRSPLSIAVLEELHRIFDIIQAEKIIFTGRDDVFASGADLREIAQITGKTAREFALRGQSLMNKIVKIRQTTIAAINGYCFGGALDLALACQKRIASPDAVFCHPGVSLGIITGWGGTQRLPRLIGEAKALEMFLTARRVSAAEALELGLIDEISQNPVSAALNFAETTELK